MMYNINNNNNGNNLHPDEIDASLTIMEKFLNCFKKAETNEYSYLKIGLTGLISFLIVCGAVILLVLGLTGVLTGKIKSQSQFQPIQQQQTPNDTLLMKISSSSRNIASSLNTCGYSPKLSRMNSYFNARKDSRLSIIRGSEAAPHSMPWIISLRLTDEIGSHFCAGSLITKQHVLTAAHCVDDRSASSLAVLVGLDNLNSFDNTNVYYVENLWINEKFDSANLINDLALIKLTKPVDFTANRASAVCLTNYDQNIIGTDLLAGGWGNTNEGSQIVLSTFLRETTLKVANVNVNDQAVACSSSSSFSLQNSKYVLCALDEKDDGSNVCLGDSGGPLVGNKNGVWYLYGVVSYVLVDQNSAGASCLPNMPSYFTRVPSYYDWIAGKLDY